MNLILYDLANSEIREFLLPSAICVWLILTDEVAHHLSSSYLDCQAYKVSVTRLFEIVGPIKFFNEVVQIRLVDDISLHLCC